MPIGSYKLNIIVRSSKLVCNLGKSYRKVEIINRMACRNKNNLLFKIDGAGSGTRKTLSIQIPHTHFLGNWGLLNPHDVPLFLSHIFNPFS